MQIPLSKLGATLLLASASLAQTPVAIPAHASVYTGFTRGFNFVAQTAFDIVQLELPTDAFVAGDTAGYMIVVNGVERLRQVGVAPGANGAGTISTSVLIVPGDDVNILGNWSAATTGNFTANNSYGGPTPFATTIEGVAHTLNRTGWQWDIGDPGYTSGTLLLPGAGSLGRVLMYTAPPSGTIPPALEMVVEQVPGSGTLGADDGEFYDGDTLRWNYNDFGGGNLGAFGTTVMNFGLGAAPAIGMTPQIPGWNQLSGLSTPVGMADFFGPFFVGAPDFSVVVPAGLFGLDDVIRFQALVLDPGAPGSLPVRPMFNTISFTFTPPPPTCTILEGFEGITTGVGNYPVGWSNGGGIHEWRPNTGGTTSASTGPTAAFEGTQYMYCETSSPVVSGDTFIMNSDTYTDQSVTQLSFYLSQIGSDIGQLDVLFNDGTTTTNIASYSGPDPAQSQGGTEWSLKAISLPQPLPASYSFQFVYTTPPVVSSTFNGDIAVDRFCLGN